MEGVRSDADQKNAGSGDRAGGVGSVPDRLRTTGSIAIWQRTVYRNNDRNSAANDKEPYATH